MTQLELFGDGGSDTIVKTAIGADDGPDWEQFFQYQQAVMKIYELEEELADLQEKYSELFTMITSMAIIDSGALGFATYVPRNRRGSE